MTAQLKDVVLKAQQDSYTVEGAVNKTALFDSGAVFTDSRLAQMANAGGRTFDLPFWRDIGTPKPNSSTDDPNQRATPLTPKGVQAKVRAANLNQVWGTTDLATELAGDNALEMVNSKLDQYWGEVMQERAIATMRGLIADSELNHDSDLLHIDQETETTFKVKGFLRAVQKLGDRKSDLVAMVVHSEVESQMIADDVIEYVQDSEGGITYPTYKGLLLLTDDTVGQNADETYDSFIVGRQFLAMAAGTPTNALEYDRDGLAANGGGVEALISRATPIVHPLGYSWTGENESEESPTLDDLKDAANWERLASYRKSIPFVVYRSTVSY